jgi:translation initiation factor 4G
MNQYFERMSMLAENQELPLRIRFMLRDVIELRRDKWVPRKATNTEGPMPIHQVFYGFLYPEMIVVGWVSSLLKQ